MGFSLIQGGGFRPVVARGLGGLLWDPLASFSRVTSLLGLVQGFRGLLRAGARVWPGGLYWLSHH